MPVGFDFRHLRVHFVPIGVGFSLWKSIFYHWESILGFVQLGAYESHLWAPESPILAPKDRFLVLEGEFGSCKSILEERFLALWEWILGLWESLLGIWEKIETLSVNFGLLVCILVYRS